MSAEAVRQQLRAAEHELDSLRREMDAEVERNGGHIPHAQALMFAAQLEDVNSRIWALKGKLRTPAPT